MKRESEKEWYYGNVDKERLGPFSFEEMKELWADGRLHAKTRCWAQGMDGWRPLASVPQLKWTLMATGQAVMNESELASLILDMLISMAEFYPSRCVSFCPTHHQDMDRTLVLSLILYSVIAIMMSH